MYDLSNFCFQFRYFLEVYTQAVQSRRFKEGNEVSVKYVRRLESVTIALCVAFICCCDASLTISGAMLQANSLKSKSMLAFVSMRGILLTPFH